MPRHVSLAARLDAALFEASSWFVIDADNRRVPGVSVASLTHGLSLIGDGRVATVVGRLRPGFAVIDVDAEGVTGDAITEHLAAWCRTRNLWHLVRPSGGAPGRHHVFVATHGVEGDMAELVATTRATWRQSRTKIDLRRDVRPLSCPHRSGGEASRIIGDPRAALATVWQVIETMPAPAAPQRRRRRPAPAKRPTIRPAPAPRASAARGAPAPSPRRTRPRRPLEDKWATYLATGRRPAWRRGDDPNADTSNSTYELMCTAAMLRAGWSADEAWQAITTAHPDAMSHARGDRDRWTYRVWGAAVASDDAFMPAPVIDADVWAATQEARTRLRSAAWSLPVRQRTTLLVVGEVIFRRMETTGTLRVPVPERDLVLDTTIRDRATIRRCLRLLGRDVGVLHRDTLDLTRKTSTSFEFEIAPALGGVCEIPPPSFHTPLPSALPQGYTLHHWLTLTSLTVTVPHDATSLTLLTQRAASPTTLTSAALTRSQRQVLTDLQDLGLAVCDAHGGWTRPEHLPLTSPAHEDHEVVRAQVAAERAAWRSGYRSRWEEERQIAHQELRHRNARWWRGLSPAQRRERLRVLGQRFDESSVAEQTALKRRLTRRDQQRGIDPEGRSIAWWQAHTPDQQQQRAEVRLRRWNRLSGPEQIAHARAWSEHRRHLRQAAPTRTGLQARLLTPETRRRE